MTSLHETIRNNFRTHGPLEYLRVYLSRMMMDQSADFETRVSTVLIIQEVCGHMTEEYEKSQGDSFEEKLIPLLESRFSDRDFKRHVKTAIYKYSDCDDVNDRIWSDVWKSVLESIAEKTEKKYPHIKHYLEHNLILDNPVPDWAFDETFQDLADQAVKCSSDWKNFDDIEEFLDSTGAEGGDATDLIMAFKRDGIKLKLDEIMDVLTIE